ncbi:polysaccharide pyruvyl transferase family protein [Stutzerimonas kunmingensis]|uniref:polysaccharide pyruvyl transferase family protein n=1 Tax=Stutzerimonas kunmingensis TaxID=1211807 RepID=UPI0028ABFE28|nr:polysaccharide pyruvyl transferase family protein [Stutzerimonas kunmingensis]
MKKISPLVSAWVGHGNFGDELLSYGLRLELYQSCDMAAVSYYEKGSEAIYQAVDDVSIRSLNTVGRPRWLRLYQRYLQSSAGYDCLFFGGGSVLHSSHSISWKHDLLRRFRRGRGSNACLTAAVGVSIGPFPDSQAERKALAFLAELDVVHCRDAASAEFAQQLDDRVEVIGGRDLAFSVRAMRPEPFMVSKQAGRVGASFILSPKLGETQQREQFAGMLAILDHLTAAGYEVQLTALYCAEKYADDRLHRRLREAAKQPERILLHDYQGDVQATAAQIASCSFYLSMRLHGLITAYLSGTPFLALNRHPKVSEFCTDALGEQAEGAQTSLDLSHPELLARLDQALGQAAMQPSYNPQRDSCYAASSAALAARLRALA